MRPHKTKKFLLASLVLSSLTLPVYGTDYTWGLSVGGEWTTGSNWTSSPPTAGYPQNFGDTATIDNQTVSPYTITTSAPSVSYSTLNLTSAEDVTLSPGGSFSGLHIIDQGIVFDSNTTAISYNLTIPIQFGPDTAVSGFSCASNVGDIQFAGTLSETTPGTALLLSFYPSAITELPVFTLSAPATYTGGTTIGAVSGNPVNLILTGAGTLSTQGTLTINSGTFDMSAGPAMQTVTDLVGTTGTINLGANTLVVTSNPAPTVFAGTIQGAGGSFFKDGTGALTLSGSLTYTGATYVNGGTLIVQGSNALNNCSQVAVGATLNLATYSGTVLTLANLAGVIPSATILAGSATISIPMSMSTSFAGGIQAPSGTVVISGLITNNLTLTGNSTYGGGTNLNGATTFITSSANLGGAANPLIFSGGNFTLSNGNATSFTGPITLAASPTINVGVSSNLTLAGAISQPVLNTTAYTKIGPGTLTVTNANNSVTGGVSGGVVILSGPFMPSSDNAIGTITATITFGPAGGVGTPTLVAGGAIAATRPIILNDLTYFDTQSNSISLGGTISGSNPFTKIGSGVLVLSGTNTFTGTTNVNLGTLNLAQTGALNSSTPLVVGSVTSVATLQAGANVQLNALATVGNTGAIFDTNNFTLGFAQGIAGSGSLTIIGTGTVLLTTTAATYTGPTYIQQGTYAVESDLPSTTNMNIAAAGILDLSQALSGQTVGDLIGAGTVILTPGLTFSAGTSNSTTFSGAILDGSTPGGSFAKVGGGTLTLSGTLSYTGQTLVDNGTLVITGNAITTVQNINNDESLIFNVTDTRVFDGVITGSGSINIQGGGSVSWTGAAANSYNGNTTISSGSLVLNMGASAIVGGTISVNGGNLIIGGANQITSATSMQVSAGLLNLGGNQIATNTLSYTGGNIAGGGTISLASSGTALTMSGSNVALQSTINLTAAGGSIISSGVQASINNVIFSSAGSQVASGGNLTLLGSSGGGFTLTSGTLTLSSGTHNYGASSSTVNSGATLVLDGAMTASALTVNAGGALQGIGTFTGSLNLQGSLAPGNSIGTINLVGSQNFGASSILVAEVSNNSNNADLVNITGSLNISPGATLQIVPTPNNVIDGARQYVLVQTTGGVLGTFVVDDSLLLQSTAYQITYTGNSVILSLIGEELMTLVSQGNAGRVARVLDSVNPAAGSDLFNVIQALQSIDNIEELTVALDMLQPSMLKGLLLAQENNSVRVQQGIGLRMNELITKACALEQSRLTLWVDALGDYFHQSNQGLEPGLNGTSGGLTVGFDCQGGQGFGGLASSYTYTNVAWKEGRGLGNVNSFYASAYGGLSLSHFYVSALFESSYNHYNEKRRIVFPGISRTAKGHFNGGELLGQIQAGGIVHSGRFEFRPFLSSEVLYLHARAFHESGANSLNLDVHSSNYVMLRSEIGFNFSRCFSWQQRALRLDGKLSYIREDRFQGNVFKTSFLAISDNFNVHGLNPDRNLFSPALSLSFLPKASGSSFSLNYEGEFGSSFWDQNVHLQYGYRF